MDTAPTMDYLKAIAANPFNILLVLLLSLISGPLNEEFGWSTWEQDCLRIRLMNNFTLDADAKDESYIGEGPVCCSSDQESLK